MICVKFQQIFAHDVQICVNSVVNISSTFAQYFDCYDKPGGRFFVDAMYYCRESRVKSILQIQNSVRNFKGK